MKGARIIKLAIFPVLFFALLAMALSPAKTDPERLQKIEQRYALLSKSF